MWDRQVDIHSVWTYTHDTVCVIKKGVCPSYHIQYQTKTDKSNLIQNFIIDIVVCIWLDAEKLTTDHKVT